MTCFGILHPLQHLARGAFGGSEDAPPATPASAHPAGDAQTGPHAAARVDSAALVAPVSAGGASSAPATTTSSASPAAESGADGRPCLSRPPQLPVLRHYITASTYNASFPAARAQDQPALYRCICLDLSLSGSAPLVVSAGWGSTLPPPCLSGILMCSEPSKKARPLKRVVLPLFFCMPLLLPAAAVCTGSYCCVAPSAMAGRGYRAPGPWDARPPSAQALPVREVPDQDLSDEALLALLRQCSAAVLAGSYACMARQVIYCQLACSNPERAAAGSFRWMPRSGPRPFRRFSLRRRRPGLPSPISCATRSGLSLMRSTRCPSPGT